MRRPFCVPAGSVAALLGLSLAACATVQNPADKPEPVGAALSQPLRDLSVIQPEAPAELARAAADPYRPSPDCAANAKEQGRLTELLGPDVGRETAKDDPAEMAGDMMADAALPFRGVIRWVSGAERRDQAMAATVLGAMVRRGFLKGEASARGCPAVAR